MDDVNIAVIKISENGTIYDDCVAYGNEFLCNAQSFRNGYKEGKNDTLDKCIKLIKSRCNPYGKPTIDFNEGMYLINIFKRMKD